MMGLKTLPFDPSDHLETAEDILFYLEAAMEGNDPRHIASALGDVARSKGMSDIARKTGLRRQALYNALSENRSEEHTSELQSLMRISYAVFCLKKKNKHKYTQ